MSFALRCLRQTEKRLGSDPANATGYAKSVNKYFDKGYARKDPLVELGGDQYFYPHFVVTKPGEPENVRIVFDATRVFYGRSMNERTYVAEPSSTRTHSVQKEPVRSYCGY